MSLLLGFGRGLQQGAAILGQGMQEDRRAKLEAMREASMEKRWLAEREDRLAARSQDVEWRESESKKREDWQKAESARNQGNTDRQFAFAEEQAGIQATEREKNSVSKTFEVLDNQFSQKMKMLQARGQKDELTGQMKFDQATIDQMNKLGQEHEIATQRALQMLGDSGRLTGTPYEAAYRMSFGSDNNLAGDVAKEMGGNMSGAAGSATGGAKKRPQISLDGSGSVTQSSAGQKPLISPGFLGGVQLGMGGLYNNQMAADRNSMSPAERATTTVGQGVGLIGGLLKDTGEIGIDGLDWITRKPAR